MEGGREQTNDGQRAIRRAHELIDQAGAVDGAFLLVTCSKDKRKPAEVDHVRFNMTEYVQGVMMLGQMVEMVVEGTNTALMDVLRDIFNEVNDRKGAR